MATTSATKRLKALNRQSASSRSGGPRFPKSGSGGDETPVSWLNFILLSAIAFFILVGISVFFGTRRIEGSLEAQALSVLTTAGFDDVEVDASGTDLSLSGTYYTGSPIIDAVTGVGAIVGVGSVDASQLYDVALPLEPDEENPVGGPIDIAWSEGTVTVRGEISSSDLRTSLVQSLRQVSSIDVVDDTGLGVVEGIPSEAGWIDEMAALVSQSIAGLPEGSFFVNPSSKIFKVSGETESRQLKNDIEATAALAADASGFLFTPGVIIPKVEDVPTEEEVEELQSNLDELIEGKVVEFQGGSAELSATGRSLLDEIYVALVANPNVPVRIHGHASSEGSSSVNQQLSEDRAASVRNYLIAKGADPNLMIAIGHGDTQPIASNSTEDGRARNRRIEFEALLEEVVTEEGS